MGRVEHLDVETSRCSTRPMTRDTQSTVISLRLRPELARVFKVEAARRGLKLNALFEEMFQAYREKPLPERVAGGGGDDG